MMIKQLQMIRLSIIADRFDNKPTNHKIMISGVTLDEAVVIVRGALKKLETELEIQRKSRYANDFEVERRKKR